MKLPFYLMLIFLVSCAANKIDIPRQWILEEVTTETIHEHFYSMCLKLNERSIYVDGKVVPINRKCEKGTGNPFKHETSEDYKIYRYRSPKEYWENLAGTEGFVLEINGRFVEVIETAVN